MSCDNTGLILVGIGSGGCRLAAVAHELYGNGMTAIGFDTDEVAINSANGLHCKLIGATRLNKHGAGGIHSNGRLAAQDDLPEIIEPLHDARIVVVVTCLGGGTGGGATPVILNALHAEGKVTLCFATLPFAFEGAVRRQTAERDRPFIEKEADTLVEVPLDDLHAALGHLALPEATRQADMVMASALGLLWRLLLTPGYIQIDPERLRNLLVGAGRARFGHVTVTGETRAEEAAPALAQVPLLRHGEALRSARAVMLGILAGPDLRLDEIGTLMNKATAICPKDAHIEMGVALDPRFAGRIELVALAFEAWIPAELRANLTGNGGQHPADLLDVNKPQREKKLETRPGKFSGAGRTIYKGEDLDRPTYQRRHIRLSVMSR